ncbi:nucleotidyltransferase family protein [Protofrankia symbiont of Coriaria ruscifolia]|uniref:nucleotidyltransferase family protein n=1 Tax=Protofrankia symbiont of Coriaria ruscifolia TaxID=1306542 RepID=UPI0010419D2C|nr:nucleotidyltransferase family protein [Protofrankia symbiont of Coriaria ruscifolia]
MQQPCGVGAAPSAAAVTPVGRPPRAYPDPDEARRIAAVARALLLNHRAATVIGILTDAGIRTVLLKGPVTAHRLYPDLPRMWRDTDLLVDPSRFADAAQLLLNQGFRQLDPAPHAQTFIREGAEIVDLHWTLPLTAAPPAQVWARLQPHLVGFDLHGHAVETLDVPAHACHLAIHAVQNPRQGHTARRDLERAVAVFPLPVWAAALDVARLIGAETPLTTALRVTSPKADTLADLLGLSSRIRFIERLRISEDPTGGVYGAARLLHLIPAPHRRVLLRRWLTPTQAEIAAYMRRPEAARSTPADWPPRLRLMLYRAQQIARLAPHIARAVNISAFKARRLSTPIHPSHTCDANAPNQTNTLDQQPD